jgi:GNAT superfamily N-acetyltransferase
MDEHMLWLTNVNYFETWRLMIEGSDQSEIHEFDGLMINDCGLPFAFFNLIFVQHPLKNPLGTLDRAVAHFQKRSLPAIICIAPGIDEKTEALVQQRGFPRVNPHPGMSLFPIPQPAEAPASMVVRPVKDENDLRLFQTTAEAGFGMPYSLPQRVLTTNFLNHPNVFMYLGYIGEKPVSTSILVVSGPVAGIYFVSTLPEYRQRGYGMTMSWHAVNEGRKLGCEIATLQASAMGRPIYAKMGFGITCDFRRYQLHDVD